MYNLECQDKVKDCVFIIQKLEDFGLRKICKGYFYVIKILDYILSEGTEIRSFGEDVYPVVAEFFNVKVNTIERNIRNYIKIISRDLPQNVLNLNSCEGLSCCKFICKLKFLISQILI